VSAVPVTDEARKRREERARVTVVNAIFLCKQDWGGGWWHLSEEQRRSAVALRVLGEMVSIETESAEVAVYCVALALEALRAKVA
jgi:hypothetical protein